MKTFSNAALSTIASFFRLLSSVFHNAGLIAVLSLIISPIGPHLLLSPSGHGVGGYSGTCAYFGSRGVVHLYGGHCPVLRIIDNRKG